jgi:hypothetical protein
VVKLRLKICASGDSTSALTALRSLVLTPSRSVLDLPVRILIVSIFFIVLNVKGRGIRECKFV